MIKPRLIAQGISLTAVMSGLCQCWLRNLSSALWWLLIACATYSLCTWHSTFEKMLESSSVLTWRCQFFQWKALPILTSLSVHLPSDHCYFSNTGSACICKLLWSDLCILSTAETILLAIFFLQLPCFGKLFRPHFVHQMKWFGTYRNKMDVWATLRALESLGEAGVCVCRSSQSCWVNVKKWRPKKIESLCSPSGNPVFPLLMFTPLTSLEDVVQGQIQLTVVRELNLHVPALSGLPSEFVVGFGTLCSASPKVSKAILYCFCISLPYLSAITKGIWL